MSICNKLLGVTAPALCATVLLAHPALAADTSVSLSVQRQAESAAPQVRSVQRDATDNERHSASANETVELLFADGTSVVLAPNAVVIIERYRYDRSSRVGELAIQVESGLVRLVGGILNNTSAIKLTVPGGTAQLDNGVLYVSVRDQRSEFTLAAGRAAVVTGTSESRSLEKASGTVALFGSGQFGSPIATLGRNALEALATAVNPGLGSGVVPVFVIDNKDVDTGVLLAEEASASGEDDTAKDVKDIPPPPPDSLPPAPCAGAGCVAGPPSFDLSASVGTVGSRQTGATVGAGQWAYSGAQPSYSDASGIRTTTARVFTARPPFLYSQTVANGAEDISSYDDLNCTDSCATTSLIKLSDVRYYFAGFDDQPANQNLVLGIGNPAMPALPPGDRPDNEVQRVFSLLFLIPSAPVFNSVAGQVQAETLIRGDSPSIDGAGFDEDGNVVRPATVQSVPGFLGSYERIDDTVTGDASFLYRSLQAGFSISQDQLSYQPGGDSFLAIEAQAAACPPPGSCFPEPADDQRFFFATGSVTGVAGASQAATLDRFTLSPGLDSSSALGRAFLRPDTLTSLGIAADSTGPLLSSDFLVLNAPYQSSVSSPSRAMHYDFAVTGDRVDQISTISLTLASVAYNQTLKAAQASGRTVGSSARVDNRYSGLVQGSVFSTAMGGGNPNLQGTGRMGYVVLENFDPLIAPQGGVERTVENGTGGETDFALLRFGQVGTGGVQPAPTNRTDMNLSGYLAGFVEAPGETSGSKVVVSPLLSVVDDVHGPAGFSLVADVAAGSVGASAAVRIGEDSVSLRLGSLAPNAAGLSAYTGAKEFGAMSAAAPDLAAPVIGDARSTNVAIVSGAPMVANVANPSKGWTAGLDPTVRTGMATNDAGTTGYRHLQWGFFFGDFPMPSGAELHANLVGWVAGRATPEGTPLPGGTAIYSGHVFANVSSGEDLYSAVGSFTNQWNFAARTGIGEMNLDSENYDLTTRLAGLRRESNGTLNSDSTARFEGRISTVADPGYIGALSGSFVADPATGGDPRSGVMGQFSLERELDGTDYRAVGTFGGERTRP